MIRVLDEAAVAAVLPMRDIIDVVHKVFLDEAGGKAHFPLRGIVRNGTGILGAMPAALTGARAALGAKLVTLFNVNAARGLHTHHAVIVLFSPQTGEPMALLDGRYITEARTGAASAVATRALARPGRHTVAILGTGVQARSHVAALAAVLEVAEMRIWGRTKERAEAVAAGARVAGIAARAAGSVEEACAGADVICTVTSANEVILEERHVEPGAHINAVGACTPDARELSAGLVGKCRIVADSLDGACHEAGDIVLAIRDGALPPQPAIATLADVLAGGAQGRRNADDITLFESLGVAIEDLACAALAYSRVVGVQ